MHSHLAQFLIGSGSGLGILPEMTGTASIRNVFSKPASRGSRQNHAKGAGYGASSLIGDQGIANLSMCSP
jgi:hypothetical protein